MLCWVVVVVVVYARNEAEDANHCLQWLFLGCFHMNDPVEMTSYYLTVFCCVYVYHRILRSIISNKILHAHFLRTIPLTSSSEHVFSNESTVQQSVQVRVCSKIFEYSDSKI
jgi:hypothetical protein